MADRQKRNYLNTDDDTALDSSCSEGFGVQSEPVRRTPNGFRLRNLEFGGRESSVLEGIGLEELIGATAFKSANLKANHAEPGVLTGMLAETMSKLEEKYHSGAYDAAAMPLVEQYLEEMRHMASLQLERYEIIAKRVSDVKEANETAYKAVYAVRQQRESDIRENSQLIQDEHRADRYRREQRRRSRQEAKDNKRLMRDLERSERLAAKRQSWQARDDARTVSDEIKAQEASMKAAQQMAEGKARIAQEELRRAETLASARQAELTGAKAAASTAEENLARARTEMVEQTLREQQETTLEEMRQSVEETKHLLDEQMQEVRQRVDELVEQAKAQVDEREAAALDDSPSGDRGRGYAVPANEPAGEESVEQKLGLKPRLLRLLSRRRADDQQRKQQEDAPESDLDSGLGLESELEPELSSGLRSDSNSSLDGKSELESGVEQDSDSDEDSNPGSKSESDSGE